MDYPDPDEEYELMYAEELELMRDQESQIGIGMCFFVNLTPTGRKCI